MKARAKLQNMTKAPVVPPVAIKDFDPKYHASGLNDPVLQKLYEKVFSEQSNDYKDSEAKTVDHRQSPNLKSTNFL